MFKRFFVILIVIALGCIFAFASQKLALAAQPRQIPDDDQIYLPLVQQDSDGPTPIIPDWLLYVNDLRTISGLPPLEDNPSWDMGCYNHARYMVLNNTITHTEDSANPWYTLEGHIAGLTGNLLASNEISTTDKMAVDLWMTSPFHGINILDAALTSTGFGSYRLNIGYWNMAACMNVLQGIRNKSAAELDYPIIWPSNGATMPYLSYAGDETPDPLASCPGYEAPSGPPIYMQMGIGDQEPVVNFHHIYKKIGNTSVRIDHCLFDESSYSNSDQDAQAEGRRILNYRDAIILIPRDPLEPGSIYTVYLSINGIPYIWYFFTEDSVPSFPHTTNIIP